MCSDSNKERKIEHRAVIKFLTKTEKSAQEIHAAMIDVYRDSCPSYSTIAFWRKQFARGRESLDDDPRSGRPPTAKTEEKVAAVRSLVLGDRRMKIWQMAVSVGISKERVGNILHEELGLKKVSARWVPKLLTPFDHHRRVETSKAFLELYEAEGDDLFHRIVTVDETYIHQYDPESKRESMQWIAKGEKPPRKAKAQKSALKIMATIFWDSRGVLLVDFLPKGSSMNGAYYADLIIQLKEKVVELRRGKVSAGVLFLQDNAPVHRSQVAMAALKDSGFREIDHPPYSPDLAPSDYFLFRNLKKDLRGIKFETEEEMKAAVMDHFADKEENYFFEGLKKLKDRSSKCIDVGGDYVEK